MGKLHLDVLKELEGSAAGYDKKLKFEKENPDIYPYVLYLTLISLLISLKTLLAHCATVHCPLAVPCNKFAS